MEEVIITNTVNRNVQTVWNRWTSPDHIINWNFAIPEWHCPRAEHQLEVGGKLKYHMAAKDGSMGFDYEGTFSKIIPNEILEYKLDDGRKVSIKFKEIEGVTHIEETFEVEDMNSIEMQRQGWNGILNNFKNYAESS